MSSPSRWLFSHPAGSPRLLDRSFHACCPQPPRKARRVLLPVASSPAFSGFILRGGLATFDLLTRPNRVYSITAHVFAARVLASSITGTHSRLATCRTGNYMVNSFQSTRSARLILAYRASASGFVAQAFYPVTSSQPVYFQHRLNL